MSYGVNSIQIHKKLRLDKRAGSDNQALSRFFPHNFLIHSRYTVFCVCVSGITLLNTVIALTVFASNLCSHALLCCLPAKILETQQRVLQSFVFL